MKICELLSNETKWTKGSFARNLRGEPCGPHDGSASSYCILGALSRCYRSGEEKERILRLMITYVTERGAKTVTSWNDNPGRRFEEVVKLVTELDV